MFSETKLKRVKILELPDYVVVHSHNMTMMEASTVNEENILVFRKEVQD